MATRVWSSARTPVTGIGAPTEATATGVTGEPASSATSGSHPWRVFRFTTVVSAVDTIART
jgi:hypothetical protein